MNERGRRGSTTDPLDTQNVPCSKFDMAMRSIPFVLLGGVLLVAAAAPAISVSGTVSYSGQNGPVSAGRPIQILIARTVDGLGSAAAVTVTSSPGEFVLEVPAAGDYVVGMFLDTIVDSRPNVGEPFQIYDHRFDPMMADHIQVPDAGLSGLSLAFDDTGILSGIGGTVTYTGSAGQVSVQHGLVVGLFRDEELTAAVQGEGVNQNAARFDFVTFDTGTYYLLAFFDVNGNSSPDAGEPFTIYRDRSAVPGDPIVAGPTQTAVDLTFGDENVIVPTPTAVLPSPTPTLSLPTSTPTTSSATCVGDCNGDAMVTVNELVTGVNIDLGSLAVSACRAFDIDGNGAVTINELIQAVSNALTSCA
jgi:hypothetical protein